MPEWRAMIDTSRLIFIHGLEGSSQGVKASLLRELFPGLLTPDFRGSLDVRMTALNEVLGQNTGWTIVGSSFGGLMGALFACQHPQQLRKLVLLAPALIWPDFVALASASSPARVELPTVIYHGTRDELIQLDQVRSLAKLVFSDLDFHAVDDDHGLYKTVHEIDWISLLA
jgi:pimeloyl-ACP methyl ester carboxylesterase